MAVLGHTGSRASRLNFWFRLTSLSNIERAILKTCRDVPTLGLPAALSIWQEEASVPSVIVDNKTELLGCRYQMYCGSAVCPAGDLLTDDGGDEFVRPGSFSSINEKVGIIKIASKVARFLFLLRCWLSLKKDMDQRKVTR